jgi:hypothetical protein
VIHFLFLVIFCLAVGLVLGAMLRHDPRDAAELAGWIAAGMVGVAYVMSWLMYLLPL